MSLDKALHALLLLQEHLMLLLELRLEAWLMRTIWCFCRWDNTACSVIDRRRLWYHLLLQYDLRNAQCVQHRLASRRWSLVVRARNLLEWWWAVSRQQMRLFDSIPTLATLLLALLHVELLVRDELSLVVTLVQVGVRRLLKTLRIQQHVLFWFLGRSIGNQIVLAGNVDDFVAFFPLEDGRVRRYLIIHTLFIDVAGFLTDLSLS